MAFKPDRNITDFFKPFAQPKFKRISAGEGRSASEPQNAPAAATTKVQQQTAKSRFSMPPSRSTSSNVRDTNLVKSVETKINDPIPTPIPSSPPVYHAPTSRFPRELSPLSSPESSPSPPSPPPTIPKKHETLVIPPMDPSVSSSSLSSLPISSQSSSKRVIRDGMLAVTNSDSDSIDTDSDPLDDIDELIRRKRLKMTPPATSSETPQRPSNAARELRSSTRHERPSNAKPKIAQPPRKKYKFSLASLVASHNKDAQAIQKIQEYEEEYQQEMDLTARHQRELKQASDMNAEEFAALLQADDGDEEQRERVARAIERNDVLEKRVEYPFFRHADIRAHTTKLFPATAASEEGWTSSLRDESVRDELFRAGFVADMARVSALPDEVVQWILSELLQDLEASLANSYVSALENSFSNTSFTTDSLRRQFLLRAGREDLEPDLFSDLPSMPPPAHQRPYVESTPVDAKWACLLLDSLANRLHVAERRSWLTILMLLLVDPQLEQRLDTLSSLQTCISTLLEADAASSTSATTIEHVGQRIRAHIPNPILIQRLIGLLPSSTAVTHMFKRRLGLASFMKSNTYLTNELDDVSTMNLLSLYLHENRAFKIQQESDFHKLGSRFETLDIIIGLGTSRFGFCGDEATNKTDSPISTENATTRQALSEEETNFNSAIDKVVAELRAIAFNIRDSGAAHMRRTECKTAIEKLSYRLEFSARTRPKPKKGIFGAAEGASDSIRNFVVRREQDTIMENGVSSSNGT
ncbi:hypothetical protein D6C91_01444 [Aureobasidium pullulans]|uniref:Uncharacterized protein n=1 Tax=Aureobasidium pullulans TaxID=5580 RepID=A0A4S9TW39_AURPU|nr:hypothetical protein D6C91_01444 [Aureobasidium pullulans]TIA55165.1 hypothetical protein D6C79_00612 [Aureobasidium pullulans]